MSDRVITENETIYDDMDRVVLTHLDDIAKTELCPICLSRIEYCISSAFMVRCPKCLWVLAFPWE